MGPSAVRYLFANILIVAFALSAQAQTTAYVANAGSVEATMINTEDLSTDLAPGTGAQRSFAVTTGGKFLYVAAGGIAVVDIAANELVTVISTGGRTEAVALTPNEKFAYVATNEQSNSVPVIDTQTNTVVATVELLGRGPKDVVVTPDGAFVYVSSSASVFVSVIETAGNTVVTDINVGAAPDGLAISADGQFVYVAVNIAKHVAKIEVASNTVVRTIGGVGDEPTSVAITPDGSKLYVAGSRDSAVTVIDAGPDTVLTEVNAGASNHRGIAVTPDGKFVYVTNLNAGSVSIINTESDTLVTMVPVGLSPRRVVIGQRASGGDPTAAEAAELPDSRFLLHANTPNPFTGRTTISYELTQPVETSIRVFDLQGRTVHTLQTGWSATGKHQLVWDGTDGTGAQVSPGTYFVRMNTSEFSRTRAVVKVQ